MIKFFKKIRQKLLTESTLASPAGRFSKYLMYAIGEIVLVVIGILIAVQINNKNIENQRRVLEERILIEILDNLDDDLKQIEDELYSDKVVMHADSIVIAHIRSKASFNDTIGGFLKIAEMFPHFDTKESGYQLLESKGIDVVKNDSLRISLTNFYSRTYPYFRKYEKERVDLVTSIIKPYFTRNFYLEEYSKWPFSKRVPFDYDAFLIDAELISILQTSHSLSNIMFQKGEQLKTDLKKLQKQINTYLKD